MKKFLLATAAAVSFIAPAQAADLPVKAPPVVVVAVYSWTGCYIGAQVGGGWGRTHHTFSNGAPADNSNVRGVLGGGHIGCNYQSGRIVFGIEGDLEAANLHGDYVNPTGGLSAGSARLKGDASVRGRIGLTFDRTLLYVTGGWAWGRYDFQGGPTPPVCCGFSSNVNGWTAGGGLQYAFTDRLSGRVEYRYTDFRDASGALVPTFPTVIMGTNNHFHAVRAGLSFSFGGPVVARY